MSGLQYLTGFPDGPPVRPGLPIADITAGMFAAFAIVSALLARERDPDRKGQYIDTSMLGSQVAMLTHQSARFFATGKPPMRYGNRHPSIAPYETFRTADGYVNVACGNDGIWQRFCRALGLHDLLEDPRFRTNADRVTNRDPLSERIEGRLVDLTTAEVVDLLMAADVPVGPVFDLAHVFADPQSQHLGLAQSTPHPKIPDLRTTGFPYRLSNTPAEVRRPPPLLGEHTAEVLREVGYTDEEIRELTTNQVLVPGEAEAAPGLAT
jgi:formyl-CoA transferase/CoA:oxalate CoA-transferase